MYCQLICKAWPRPRLGLGISLALPDQLIGTRPFMPRRFCTSHRFTYSRTLDTCHYYRSACKDSLYLGVGLGNCNKRHFNVYGNTCVPPTFQHREHNMVDNSLEVEEKDGPLDQIQHKLLFNSVLEKNRMKGGWLKKKIEMEKYQRSLIKNNEVYKDGEFPIALKYMIDVDDDNVDKDAQIPMSSIENDKASHETIVQLPYSVHNEDYTLNSNQSIVSNDTSPVGSQLTTDQSDTETESEVNYNDGPQTVSGPKYNWMRDYEIYPDSGEEISLTECDEEKPWELNYGTPDASIPVSKVPCGGCGALLHCQDTAIPGYLPSELFKDKTDADLRPVTCQRCHFLRHYDTALSVNVAPDEYPRLLAQIKDKKALVILMVDLMDFPSSIWPNILDIIGTKRPVVVVGNKVDLLPQDSPGFLAHIKNVLVRTLEYTGVTAANIKHVALISAKTGFGIDELITKLHTSWEYKGDVYLIGCTNVGKSSLFNALLQSDYCKVKAADLIQRATTSPWPGTTLNLLKFPILRPASWRMYERTQRLISERHAKDEERRFRQNQAKKTRTAATLIGHIGRTFRTVEKETSDPFSVSTTGSGHSHGPLLGLNPKDKTYERSKWCYDTPGTVQPDQVINLLTTEELMLTLPKTLLYPRTFSLVPGRTLFIAGLGRLDYLEGYKAIRFTVFASEGLPLTVTRTEDADEIYSALIGSEFMAVPSGGAERLAQWPRLEANTDTIKLTGEDFRESCADVVLSSAGWVAITPGPGAVVELRAWTPGGRGIFVRPPLLRFSVNHRGARLRGSPAYKRGNGIYTQ